MVSRQNREYLEKRTVETSLLKKIERKILHAYLFKAYFQSAYQGGQNTRGHSVFKFLFSNLPTDKEQSSE